MRMQAYLSITSLTKAAVVNPYSEGLLTLYRTRPHSRRSTLRLASVFHLLPPVTGSKLGPDSDANQNLYGKKVGTDHLWGSGPEAIFIRTVVSCVG